MPGARIPANSHNCSLSKFIQPNMARHRHPSRPIGHRHDGNSVAERAQRRRPAADFRADRHEPSVNDWGASWPGAG